MFRSAGAFFLYDVNHNRVLKIERELYDAICYMQKHGMENCEHFSESTKSSIDQLVKDGYLKSSDIITRIENYSSDYYKSCLDARMNSLVLEVTQNCNYRCSYCPFSATDNFDRVHNEKRMTFELAKKAIDLYAQHSTYQEYKSISFYGGEPLLEYSLIKKCVEYSVQKFGIDKLSFHMTTNASLLTLDVIKFLSKNNFYLVISLDGYKEYHDKNRKQRDFSPSFDTVYRNIELIHNNQEKYPLHLRFNAVWDGSVTYESIEHFFLTDSILKNYPFEIGAMSSNATNNKFVRDEQVVMADKFELLKKWINGTYNIYTDPNYKYLFDRLENHAAMFQIYHHAGPCIAGQTKLFVTPEGVLYPCERYSKNCECAKIGRLDEEIAYDNVYQLLNYGHVCADDCKHCWAIRLCSMCPMTVNGTDVLSYELKKANCTSLKKQILNDLKAICAFEYLQRQNMIEVQ